MATPTPTITLIDRDSGRRIALALVLNADGTYSLKPAASTALYAGTATLSTSAAAIASTQVVTEVLVQSDPDNTADIFVGSSASQPIQLKPGWSVTIPASDLALIYAKSASGTPVLNYLGRA